MVPKRAWLVPAMVAAAWMAPGEPLRAGQDIAALPEEARLEPTEEFDVAVLPEASPRWIYILDVAFDNLVASRINIFDAETGAFVSVVHSGFVPNLLLAPDKSELYVNETYFSRGTQGERVDVVSIYDARTLLRTGEVILPQGRGLFVPKQPVAALSPDGRFLLSYNMAPATSVSLVDIRARRYVGEIEVPGCALVYPTGLRSFSMLCPDGSFVDIAYDEEGGAEVMQNEPFFDSENDPVFEHAALATEQGRGYWISYEGMLYEVVFEEGRTRVVDSWSVVEEADRAESWRPGGWQLMAYDRNSGLVYVLMHRGPRWSHKFPGEEVWVLDPEANRRVKRLSLEEPSVSILVTPEKDPVLVALTDTGVLGVYDLESGELARRIEGVGVTPFLLHAFAE